MPVLALAACAHTPPAAGPRPPTEFERHVRSYQVNPLNGNDLAQAIRDERKQFTSTAIGMTHSDFRWSVVAIQPPSGPCALTSINVRVESTISIPEWHAPPGTSGARLSWWQRIASSVAEHERHHATISEESGADLAATLQQMTAVDCRTLRELAESAGRAELARMRERQQAFDGVEGTIEIPAPPP